MLAKVGPTWFVLLWVGIGSAQVGFVSATLGDGLDYATLHSVCSVAYTIVFVAYICWNINWKKKFFNRVQEYMQELNRGVLAESGINFEFVPLCYCNKGRLHIRRVTNELSSFRPLNTSKAKQ